MSNINRDAISRSYFFLLKAKPCGLSQRNEYESYIEASIIFARTAIHRLKSKHEKHPKFNNWWKSLKNDPSVNFFRNERNFILKEGPPKIGQVVRVGTTPEYADNCYYYDSPEIKATDTIEKHLKSIENTINQAVFMFKS